MKNNQKQEDRKEDKRVEDEVVPEGTRFSSIDLGEPTIQETETSERGDLSLLRKKGVKRIKL